MVEVLQDVANAAPSINWAAAAVLGLVLLAGGQALRRAASVRSSLRREHHEDRARTRAVIESDHIIPQLTDLIEGIVNQQAMTGSSTQDILDSVNYLSALSSLSDRYGDHREIDRLLEETEVWALRRIWAVSGFLFAFSILAGDIVTRDFAFPRWSVIGGGILSIVGATLWLASWVFGVLTLNRLSALYRRYE